MSSTAMKILLLITLLLSTGLTVIAGDFNNKEPTVSADSDYVKPGPAELKKRLTKIQYSVTQNDDTERPFKNEYWDEKRDGIWKVVAWQATIIPVP